MSQGHSSLRPSSRLLASRILAATSMLVRSSLQGNWNGASAIATHRRTLLSVLERDKQPAEVRCVHALTQAVVESDQALAAIRSVPLAGTCGSAPR